MYSLVESNNYLKNLINQNKPFFITRTSLGAETLISYHYITNSIKMVNKEIFHMLDNNCGIYDKTKDINNIFLYCKKYLTAIENSNAVAIFPKYKKNEQYIITKTKNIILPSRILEPFYLCDENIKPWSHELLGKKVLIISPFIESFKKQLDNKFLIFKNPEKKIFLDNQEFKFYKCFVTNAGNHIHTNWLETLNIMCNDISKIDFDIALISCGGYGLLIGDYIHNTLNKSAIYIGGGLQLLFGVMGKRWEKREDWIKRIKENDSKFIKPSGNEITNNNYKIEGGCYW
tara:strand:+ start:570 stop:1433 length:864 start_codon:yes stop_codon:yes gene_type:complete